MCGNCGIGNASKDLSLYATKSYVQKLVDSLRGNLVPVGTIAVCPKHTIPDGWLVCNGTQFDVEAFPDLYEFLGSDTLPNGQGMTVVGWKNSSTFNVLGSTGGSETVTLTEAQMPQHSHDPISPNTHFVERSGSGSYTPNYPAGTSQYVHSNKTGNTGGSEAHDNLQPYIVWHWIIFGG